MNQPTLNFLRISANEATKASLKVYEYAQGTEYEHLAAINYTKASKLSSSIQREFHEKYPENCPCSDCVKLRANSNT